MSSEYTTLVQGLETYRLADLRPYHANPRRGDVAQIARSLSRTGQYRPIVVNAGTKTGRYREVLAGNHTLAAAQKLGWSHLAGSVVDVDDDTAARIVAADNRTAELGGYDDAQLLALLDSVAAAEQGLDGPQSGVQGARSYFDNAHDTMTDVWRFPRVHGAERHGHATPKPVAMVSRALVSSSPAGALVLEPFAGTGSTLIAAHDTGRVCYTAELSPAYVDTTVRRWQQHTGGTPQRNGVPHSLEP